MFSPPAQLITKEETNKPKNAADIRQMQEDLQQEKRGQQSRTRKKERKRCKIIVTDYNKQYGTNHD